MTEQDQNREKAIQTALRSTGVLLLVLLIAVPASFVLGFVFGMMYTGHV